ncbi:MAG: DUF3109 family protein [Bacteroidales bacterium]|nr:DUF3109 family protein [Bacteroidales bacterium]
MLKIGDTIVSLDLLSERFCCDLSVCKGNCCRYGDAGAPLTDDEAKILREIYPKIRKYLRNEGAEAIDSQGTSVTDMLGEPVTTLVDNAECAYAVMSGDIFMCGIEKAWNDGATTFRKPVSCHLFPVRVREYADFTAVNYERWSICQGGRDNGRKEDLRVYRFLKAPLIRAFGNDWYSELEIIRRELPASGLAEI